MYRQIPFVYASGFPDWTKGEGMYNVDVYSRIRRACHVERMSIREAAASEPVLTAKEKDALADLLRRWLNQLAGSAV